MANLREVVINDTVYSARYATPPRPRKFPVGSKEAAKEGGEEEEDEEGWLPPSGALVTLTEPDQNGDCFILMEARDESGKSRVAVMRRGGESSNSWRTEHTRVLPHHPSYYETRNNDSVGLLDEGYIPEFNEPPNYRHFPAGSNFLNPPLRNKYHHHHHHHPQHHHHTVSSNTNDSFYSYAYDCNVSPAVLLQSTCNQGASAAMTQPRSRQPVAVIPECEDEEENIYEEIADVEAMMSPAGKKGMRVQTDGESVYSTAGIESDSHSNSSNNYAPDVSSNKSRSFVEEMIDEVKKVQRRHHKVLGQLNLEMEAMLMPSNPVEDLDLPVGPTDELLSPDSGFHSGSGCVSGPSATMIMPSLATRTARYVAAPSRSYSYDASTAATSLAQHGTRGQSFELFPPNATPPRLLRHQKGYEGGEDSRSKKCLTKEDKRRKSTSNTPSSFEKRASLLAKKGWKFRGWGSGRNKRSSLDLTNNSCDGVFSESRNNGIDGRRGSTGSSMLKSSNVESHRSHNSTIPSWERASPQHQVYEEVDHHSSESQHHTAPSNCHHTAPSNCSSGQHFYPPPQSTSLDRQNSHQPTEEAWWSADSETPSSASDSGTEDEDLETGSEKSGGSLNRGLDISTFKSKFLRAAAFKDKWKESRTKTKSSKESLSPEPEGRLSRWFSLRKSNQNEPEKVVEKGKGKMPKLPEEEENGGFTNNLLFQRRHQPPTLPPLPPGLTTEQIQRRHIIATIVSSENSYVSTLQRLVNDYKKPLEDSQPPILNAAKITTLFSQVPEILQCHTLFRIALSECVRNWDKEERIGDVFVASFSKAIVLEIYSDFINNFSVSMELAKSESKRKSALADFLKVKQITSHDRLSFFGMMVKPVQRFPQFIMLLQDLLKHTPHGHHDRMALQLALTQLESLAELLNERKRESEQYQAFKEMLNNISGKFAIKPLSDGNRFLLREDTMTQLEFNQSGLITKNKSRRLLLLNDLLVCVAVVSRTNDDFSGSERLTLKWTFPVTDIEILDNSTSPFLSRILTAGLNRSGSLPKSGSIGNSNIDDICQEMNDLMHDYEVVSRISGLITTLKTTYNELNCDIARSVLTSIQKSIQKKDEEIAWADSRCLQIVVRNKPGKEENFTFQTDIPEIKKDWIVELRLAQLALDTENSPAWDIPEQEKRPSTKMPLFVKCMTVYKSQHQTEVRCGCFYTVNVFKPTRRVCQQSYLWICTTDGVSSHIAKYAVQQVGITDVAVLDLVETKVTTLQFVPGFHQELKLKGDVVFMGTDSRKLIVYSAFEPEKHEEIASTSLSSSITHITYHCDQVFVGLSNGTVVIIRRNHEGEWNLQDTQTVLLGTDPVTGVLPISEFMYVGCGKKVWVLDGISGYMQKNFSVQHEHIGNVHLMAHFGIGLWISLQLSSTICLYHTETFKHLQDINIASNVNRILAHRDLKKNTTNIYVTSLMACKGLLWVGTNVGIALTIPLPRLEGVPIISGRANISYHAHFGPISFLLALHPRRTLSKSIKKRCSNDIIQEEIETNESNREDLSKTKLEKQISESGIEVTTCTGIPTKPNLKPQLSSPILIRRRPKENSASYRACKTLPRGLGMFSVHSSQESDVFGLYGELLNVKDYDEDHPLNGSAYEALRRSDPELAIPNKVNTLDRRLQMKASRPRSLDLSNWSVESKSSMYTSSGSEESVPLSHSILPSHNINSENNTKASTLKKSYSTVTNKPVLDAPRTIVTLMGGRGYINWRKASLETKYDKNKQTNVGNVKANNNDAHMIVWEMKL